MRTVPLTACLALRRIDRETLQRLLKRRDSTSGSKVVREEGALPNPVVELGLSQVFDGLVAIRRQVADVT